MPDMDCASCLLSSCMILQAIMAYDQFGKDTEMIVQDSSSFAEDGERISFLQVQVRGMALAAEAACIAAPGLPCTLSAAQ